MGKKNSFVIIRVMRDMESILTLNPRWYFHERHPPRERVSMFTRRNTKDNWSRGKVDQNIDFVDVNT